MRPDVHERQVPPNEPHALVSSMRQMPPLQQPSGHVLELHGWHAPLAQPFAHDASDEG